MLSEVSTVIKNIYLDAAEAILGEPGTRRYKATTKKEPEYFTGEHQSTMKDGRKRRCIYDSEPPDSSTAELVKAIIGIESDAKSGISPSEERCEHVRGLADGAGYKCEEITSIIDVYRRLAEEHDRGTTNTQDAPQEKQVSL